MRTLLVAANVLGVAVDYYYRDISLWGVASAFLLGVLLAASLYEANGGEVR